MTLTTIALNASPVVNIIVNILLMILTAGIIFVGVKFYEPIKHWLAKWSIIGLFKQLRAMTETPEYQRAIRDIQQFFEDYQQKKITLEHFIHLLIADKDIMAVLFIFIRIINEWANGELKD